MKKLWLISLLLILIIISLFVILHFQNTFDVQDINWETGLIPAKLIPELGKLEMESSVRFDTPLAVDENYLYALTPNNHIVKYDKHNDFKKVMSKDIKTQEHIRDFAVDDKFLYAISWDGNIRIYNKIDLNENITIKGHSDMVMALHLTKDYVYTGSWDCSLKIWDKKNFFPVHTFILNDTNNNLTEECCQINSIGIDKDKIYIACENPYLIVLDKKTKRQDKLEVSNDLVSDTTPLNVDYLDFDDRYLYSVSGNFLRIWDKSNLSLIKKLVCSSTHVSYSVKVDKNRVYCGGSEVYFLDKPSFTPVKVKLPFDKQIVHNMAFDRNNVYLGSMENNIFIIDKNNKQIKTFFEIS